MRTMKSPSSESVRNDGLVHLYANLAFFAPFPQIPQDYTIGLADQGTTD